VLRRARFARNIADSMVKKRQRVHLFGRGFEYTPVPMSDRGGQRLCPEIQVFFSVDILDGSTFPSSIVGTLKACTIRALMST
jgi:hypothetical protein